MSRVVKRAAPPASAEVALSIYELHGTSALNLLTRAAGMGGAYHVAVEVYFLEWSYGYSDVGSGVYMIHPGKSTLGTFRERVPLGRTLFQPEEVFEILDVLRAEFLGYQYDLLRKNCAHFSVAFVDLLKVPEAPQWVNGLANVGERLVAKLGIAGAQQAADKATPPEGERHAPYYEKFDDEDLEDEARDGDELALREYAWRQSKAHVLKRFTEVQVAARYLDTELELSWSAPDGMDEFTAAELMEELIELSSVWQALVEAAARGFNLPVPDSEGSHEEEEGQCGDLKVNNLKITEGRRLSLYLRSKGEALTADGDMLPWNQQRFRTGLLTAAGRERGLFKDWPPRGVVLISGLSLLTAPDQTIFGRRVETSAGPASGSVIHSRQESKTPGGYLPRELKIQRQANVPGMLHENEKAVRAALPKATTAPRTLSRRLVVKVLSAKFASGGSGRFSGDPFIKVRVGQAEKQTKAVKNDGHPVFNETFEFQVTGTEVAVFSLWDSDRSSAKHDDFIGRMEVVLRKESLEGSGSSFERNLIFQNTASKEERQRSCLLQVALRYSSDDEGKVTDNVPRIAVTVISAERLVNAKFHASTDPFVRVRVGHQVKDTPTVISDTNPVFNHRMDFAITGPEVMVCSVFDADRTGLGEAQLLGRAEIPLRHHLEDLSEGQVVEFESPLAFLENDLGIDKEEDWPFLSMSLELASGNLKEVLRREFGTNAENRWPGQMKSTQITSAPDLPSSPQLRAWRQQQQNLWQLQRQQPEVPHWELQLQQMQVREPALRDIIDRKLQPQDLKLLSPPREAPQSSAEILSRIKKLRQVENLRNATRLLPPSRTEHA